MLKVAAFATSVTIPSELEGVLEVSTKVTLPAEDVFESSLAVRLPVPY